MFHDCEHLKHPESGARDNAEVAGDDGRSVILEEGCLTLIAGGLTRLVQPAPDWFEKAGVISLLQYLTLNVGLFSGRIFWRS
jgi:hypothetical protein